MEGDITCAGGYTKTVNFYPRPHMEGDIQSSTRDIIDGQFLPTPSHGGRPVLETASDFQIAFLPTPSHGGRHYLCQQTKMKGDFYPRPHMEGDSKHAEVQACISVAYLKCSTRKAAASRRCAGLGGRAVLFHQLSRLVLGRARCEPRGEGMCDRGSHRQSGRRKGLKTHSSKMSSWLH